MVVYRPLSDDSQVNPGNCSSGLDVEGLHLRMRYELNTVEQN